MDTHIRCRASYACTGRPIETGPSQRVGGPAKGLTMQPLRSVPPFVTEVTSASRYHPKVQLPPHPVRSVGAEAGLTAPGGPVRLDRAVGHRHGPADDQRKPVEPARVQADLHEERGQPGRPVSRAGGGVGLELDQVRELADAPQKIIARDDGGSPAADSEHA